MIRDVYVNNASSRHLVVTHPKLLPAGAMAQRLRVTTRWLRDEADAGRLPHLKAGDRYMFHPDTVEQLLIQRACWGPTIPDVHTVDTYIRATKARLQALRYLRKAAERQEQTQVDKV